jgi:glutamate---cysteine ligase / carboxylate-amine ligase
MTLGVEEELFFVDAQTLDVTAGFSRVVGEGDDRVKPEVFESIVELATPPLPDAAAVLAELTQARERIAARAAEHGLRVYAAGSHPFAAGDEQKIVPLERYERMVESIGQVMWQQLVCGLHVHVSVPRDEVLHVYEGVVPWLPTLLALSANSPFAECENTGYRSIRAERLLLMPTGGTPPVLDTWGDWHAWTGRDSSRRHWDAWPRPEYGTLEVRVMDMQTDVHRSAGFAELVRALVVAAEPHDEPYDRDLYARRRADAAAGPPDPAEVEALAALVAPVLELDVDVVLGGRPEAERQLELGIAAVPADVAERTLAF